MTVNTEDYQKILDFICKVGEIDDLQHFIDYIDNFLQNDFQSSPVLVYSFNPKKPASGHIRSHRSKEIEKLYYHKADLQSFNEEVKKAPKVISKIGEKDLFYYVIPLGMIHEQTYFLCFKCNRAMSESILDYFFQFLKNTITKINKLNEASGLKNLVFKDDVTGLFNQRRFASDIDAAIDDSKKSMRKFSVIFIDIDHFKQVNDGHGHLVGTKLLKDVASIIKECVRPSDFCYRYGGDEFVVLVKNCSFEESKVIGERVLSNISQEVFVVDDSEGLQGNSEFKLTVSIGVACFPDDASSRTEIIKIADKMMYKAKQTGRGRVCHTKELFSDK